MPVIGYVAFPLLSACDARPSLGRAEGLQASSSESGAGFAPLASAAPARVWYLRKSGDRCVIESAPAAGSSQPAATFCPDDLAAGERIVLARQVCMREGDDPGRKGPIRCPKRLFWSAQGVPWH